MDVHGSKFWAHFSSIIQDIAEAEYVAIDLEMTGIETRHQTRLSKPSKQEIYEKAREAASCFDIFQIGISCVRYDVKRVQEAYVSRTYNFHVSQLFQNGFDSSTSALVKLIDRKLTISYKTLLFLRENRIRLEDSYIDGIPYISRAEEFKFGPSFLFTNRGEKPDYIDVSSLDESIQRFYSSVKESIRLWDESPKYDNYLNVSNPQGGRLNRLQQRLVHQVLAKHFQGKYRGYCLNNDFIQVVRNNEPHEKEFMAKRLHDREYCLKAQTGVRYIFEALAGGAFARDAAAVIDRKNNQTQPDNATDSIFPQLDGYEKRLKRSPPILVGHNMFLDLCFLYQTFVAPLPNSLDEFGTEVHRLFPRIVDTKHMVNTKEPEASSSNSLEEIHERAVFQPQPKVIRVDSGRNTKTPRGNSAHQAGYDSFMTANIFVKKTWELSMKEDNSGKTEVGPGQTTVSRRVEDTKTGNRLPDWTSGLLQTCGNTLRIGDAGSMKVA